MSLAERLREELARTGRSARSVSLEAGLSCSALRQILNGRSAAPRGDTILRLAEVLGLPPSELLQHCKGIEYSDAAPTPPNWRPSSFAAKISLKIECEVSIETARKIIDLIEAG